MGELRMMTIPDGGAYWATLFHQIFPALVFGQPIHRITPFEEASALTALVHEFIGITFLLTFADGPHGLRAGHAADRFAGGRKP